MPSKNTTTVVLTKTAQDVKDNLAPVFGLKNILSAGLILFGRLTDAEQKAAISEANGLDVDVDSVSEAEFRRRVLEIVREVQKIEERKIRSRRTKTSR